MNRDVVCQQFLDVTRTTTLSISHLVSYFVSVGRNHYKNQINGNTVFHWINYLIHKVRYHPSRKMTEIFGE